MKKHFFLFWLALVVLRRSPHILMLGRLILHSALRQLTSRRLPSQTHVILFGGLIKDRTILLPLLPLMA